MKHRISPAVVLSALALFFSLGGVGIAASGYRITSIFQIKPSVRAALHGDLGPQGPQGLTGPVGPQGSPGPAGPSATVRVQSQSTDVTVPAGSHITATVACPSNELATGGGFTADPALTVSSSRPDDALLLGSPTQVPTGWAVVVDNPSGTDRVVTPWVVCSA